MDKYLEHLKLDVAFYKARPLSGSKPPVPEVVSRTRMLDRGSVHGEGCYPLPCDIRLDQDVAIPMRDGTTLYADVFRPVTSEAVPIILVYTPYCKRGGFWNFAYDVTKFGVPAEHMSGLQAFESPDPGYWCAAGYAVAVVDAAGTSHSGGDQPFMGTASARSVYDAIEWLGVQAWSNGKVGMAGNSQLAMIQWAAAALQPPHLAAIAPWEGLNDSYRDVTLRGGIPDTKFHDEDIQASIYGLNDVEDLSAMAARYPLYNAYWADKRADAGRITVPAYVVASFTSAIHPRGTLQAYREMASKDKWLRIHNNQEWLDLADADSRRDLNRFFDRYLKGAKNDWEQTPRVRLSVLDPGGTDIVGRAEQTWPLARQKWRTLYLNAEAGTLSAAKAAGESVAEYTGDDQASSVRFVTSFDKDTEITGYLKVHLWVEAPGASDMDLFAALYKESADGKRLHHITMTAPGARGFVMSLERDGKLPGTLSYTGPLGRLRVSHRALDAERSTPSEPFLTHAAEQPLSPGEKVSVELGLWPTSLVVHPGERLVLEIAGYPVGPPVFENLPGSFKDLPTRNRGLHRILTGGKYDSHLLVPVIE